MKQNRLLNSVTYAFLVLFLATKLVGLHALTHHDDKEDYMDHCAICHNIASDTHAPGILNDSLEPLAKNIEFVLQKEIGSEYNFQVSSSIATSLLFSRPPPAV